MENAQLQNKMLQMEMAKMVKDMEKTDAEIEYKKTAAIENIQADIRRKQAQADENLARKEKLEAETDILDHEFIEMHSGKKRDREVEDMVYKEHAKAAQLDAKNRTALANKTVGEE